MASTHKKNDTRLEKRVIICRFTNLQKPAFPNCETISEKSSDIKSQRSLGTHHLQYIQSKEDDKYYRICARHKAENQYAHAHGFQALRHHCIKNGHDSVMSMNAWAEKHL